MLRICNFVWLVLLAAARLVCGSDSVLGGEAVDGVEDLALDPAALFQKALGIRKSAMNSSSAQYQVLHHATPRFMQELYNAVADDHGYTRAATPYNADTVWGMMNLDTSSANTFWFNVSGMVEAHTHVYDAELHLFRIKPRVARVNRLLSNVHLIEVRVYQILSKPSGQSSLLTQINDASVMTLITSEKIPVNSFGWKVFRVSSAVLSWLGGSANLGFFVVAFVEGQSTPFENQNVLKFVQTHEEKQPCLVVFSSSEQLEQPATPEVGNDFNVLRDSYTPENEQRLKQLYDHEFSERIRMLNRPLYELADYEDDAEQNTTSEAAGLNRVKRSTNARRGRVKPKPCRLEKMFVNFTVLGWDKWIISPKAYDAHICRGECTYPIGHHMNATNHAIVQSLLAATRRTGIPPPCCVPGETKSLSLLYYEDTNVVLRRYDEMIAHSCVCR